MIVPRPISKVAVSCTFYPNIEVWLKKLTKEKTENALNSMGAMWSIKSVGQILPLYI